MLSYTCSTLGIISVTLFCEWHKWCALPWSVACSLCSDWWITATVQIQHHVERHVEEHVDRAFKRSGPAWLLPLLIIFGGLAALGGVAWFSYVKSSVKSGVVVVKDGRA